MIAIFFKSIKANAVFFAAIITEAIVLIIYIQDGVSFLWLNVIGALIMILMACLIKAVVK